MTYDATLAAQDSASTLTTPHARAKSLSINTSEEMNTAAQNPTSRSSHNSSRVPGLHSKPGSESSSASQNSPSIFSRPFSWTVGMSQTDRNVPAKPSTFFSGSYSSADDISSSIRDVWNHSCFRPMGVGGIGNMGNSCYMNSAIQCLAHTPLLPHFFLSQKFRSDLNRGNVLGKFVSLLYVPVV
jgi:hypothetical protein